MSIIPPPRSHATVVLTVVPMVIHVCTCAVITGGYRVPTSVGCPIHSGKKA